jgi:hypothetical protein
MLRIAARFQGPPESGNGGYSAGLLAKQLGGCVEVTLRKPPPLEQELALALGASGGVELRHGSELIAEARASTLELVPPAPPSFERASELCRHYVGHLKHYFPGCFVCGPARAQGDGLRIFPGRDPGTELFAAPWIPDASLAERNQTVPAEVMWAALDCPGYFAAAAPSYPVALLGRMTAEVESPVQVGERCVVIGWSLGREGRKLYAATALFGGDGRLCGKARQTWIELQS